MKNKRQNPNNTFPWPTLLLRRLNFIPNSSHFSPKRHRGDGGHGHSMATHLCCFLLTQFPCSCVSPLYRSQFFQEISTCSGTVLSMHQILPVMFAPLFLSVFPPCLLHLCGIFPKAWASRLGAQLCLAVGGWSRWNQHVNPGLSLQRSPLQTPHCQNHDIPYTKTHWFYQKKDAGLVICNDMIWWCAKIWFCFCRDYFLILNNILKGWHWFVLPIKLLLWIYKFKSRWPFLFEHSSKAARSLFLFQLWGHWFSHSC